VFLEVLIFGALLISILGFACALRDHLQIKRKLRQLHRQVEEARALAEKRGTLAKEIAHDIKNPLTAILCSAETLELLAGKDLDESQRQSIHYIKEYGTHLLQLMTDFLDIHRAEGGQLKCSPQQVELLPVVQSVIGLLDASAKRKTIAIRFDSNSDCGKAIVDPKHLRQVLFNLVHNAIKFTPEGGTVKLSIKNELPEGKVCISVADNGVGIPDSHLATIFDPYSRLEHVIPGLDVGMGLGLALCKALVELANGAICARSQLNVGSIFEFSIPMVPSVKNPEPSATYLVAKSSTNKPLLGQSFLIVDNDDAARQAVSKLIAAWGGMVDQVSFAADAVEAIARNSYDAVVIDETPDHISIQELARIIKDDLREDTTVIVAKNPSSANLGADSKRIDKVLEKPYNGEILLQSLLHSGKYEVTH
jgi:signal transduction histidine kinase/CheY-like chemotaxis protein